MSVPCLSHCPKVFIIYIVLIVEWNVCCLILAAASIVVLAAAVVVVFVERTNSRKTRVCPLVGLSVGNAFVDDPYVAPYCPTWPF